MALNTTPYMPLATPSINAYSGGGAAALQALLAGGNPQEMRTFAEQVIERSAILVKLITELKDARDKLKEVWPEGTTSDATTEQTTKGLTTFLDSIQPMVSAANTITAAAQGLDAAQTTTKSTLSSAEAIVSALASNPWTQGAAAATANGTVGSLSGFLSGTGSIMTALGSSELGRQVSTLGTLIGGVESLASALGIGTGGDDRDAHTAGNDLTASLYDPRTQSYQPYSYNSSTGSYTPTDGSSGYANGYNPYADNQSGGYNPYGNSTQPSGNGAYATFTDPVTGQLKATTVDPSSGWPVGGSAGSGVGDWVPVDADSGGGGSTASAAGTPTETRTDSAGASTAGAGSGASVSGDDTTQITVSSGGETVSFTVAGDNETDIVAEVGPKGGETAVTITVNPDEA